MRQDQRPRRNGVAAVEFAVVVPVFFIVVFGMVEFGRAVMVQQVLVNASREGARTAVLEVATLQSVEDSIDTYLDASGITDHDTDFTVNGSVVTDPTGNNSGAGDSIGVAVSVEFNDVSWLPIPEYLGGTTLRAESVMRRETYQ